MTPTAPQDSGDGVEEILRQLEVEILEAVGDEFAPKQESGSPERKRLLGLIAVTTPLILEARAAIELLLLEARINELKLAKRNNMIAGNLMHRVDRRIASLEALQSNLQKEQL